MLYGRARRAASLGLCDPMTCNRFLLWALFGAFQVSAYLSVFPSYILFEIQVIAPALWDRVYAVFSTIAVVMIWFVFFPPVFYKRWIRGSAVTASRQEA